MSVVGYSNGKQKVKVFNITIDSCPIEVEFSNGAARKAIESELNLEVLADGLKHVGQILDLRNGFNFEVYGSSHLTELMCEIQFNQEATIYVNHILTACKKPSLEAFVI